MEALTTYLLIASAFLVGIYLLLKGVAGMRRNWSE
jgi:hypothetical protein